MEEIINNLDNYDLIKIAMELRKDVIPENALIRQIASKIYHKEPKNITISQMLIISPTIANELANRLMLILNDKSNKEQYLEIHNFY